MGEDSDFPHWDGERRADGLVVAHTFAAWVILPPDDRVALDYCTCCGRTLMSAREAKKLADHIYPLRTHARA